MIDPVRKQQAKQLLRRTIGEPYVGKRVKLARLRHVLPELSLQPRAILDAGAEDATFVYWLADRYRDAVVTAVDVDEAAIAACLANRPARYRERVRFTVGSFDALPDGHFDLITAFDVLEHIEDDAAAAGDLVRALRPGGTLLVHVPRDRWLDRDGTVQHVPDSEAWTINPGHVRQGYSPATLRALVENAGAEVIDVQTWVGRWGTLAHTFYARVEHPAPLRVLSIPMSELGAALDRRHASDEGNTVFLRAVRPPGT